MQVLTDVQKRDGTFELGTHRLLGIRMPTQRETKHGSYVYQILSRSSRIPGWKKCQKIGHFTSLMTFCYHYWEALSVMALI